MNRETPINYLSQYNGQNNIYERLNMLEKRINNLEKKINMLENSIMPYNMPSYPNNYLI